MWFIKIRLHKFVRQSFRPPWRDKEKKLEKIDNIHLLASSDIPGGTNIYRYNIDENESLYDQLKAKNLFICGCESVRMEVQKALGFLDDTFYIGLASSSQEHCRANDDYLSWNNNPRGLDLTGSILIKKEWEEYYGY